MAQHDYVISNGTGAAVRSDLNNALAAIVSQNSGATAPSPTYAFQFWADTTAGVLKLRNSANSAWITLFQLDGEWTTLPVENGTAAAPSIYFKDSGTDTGFYSPGTDQVGISTAGTSRLTIDANGNLAVDTNTLYVDAPNNRVGIGSSAPGAKLTIQQAANTITEGLLLVASSGSVNGGWYHNGSALVGREGGFDTINLAAGKVGIGVTAPIAQTHIRLSAVTGYTSPSNDGLVLERGGGNDVAISIATDNTRNGYLIFADGDSANPAWVGYDHSANAMSFRVNASERARIDSSGRLLLGTSSSRGAYGGNLEIEATTAAATIAVTRNSNDAFPAYLFLAKSRSASVGGNTIVASGDELGNLSFSGSDGVGPKTAASITAAVDATPGANDMPGRLVFSTTADGASSPTERLRIANNGAWGLAGANYGSSGQVLTSNGSGSAPTWSTSGGAGTLQAWVNFNGTGTVAIRASGNVSSITDNGTGDYTVNFTTAMPDANYAIAGAGQLDTTTNDSNFILCNIARTASNPATGSLRLTTLANGPNKTDATVVAVAIFR